MSTSRSASIARFSVRPRRMVAVSTSTCCFCSRSSISLLICCSSCTHKQHFIAGPLPLSLSLSFGTVCYLAVLEQAKQTVDHSDLALNRQPVQLDRTIAKRHKPLVHVLERLRRVVARTERVAAALHLATVL